MALYTYPRSVLLCTMWLQCELFATKTAEPVVYTRNQCIFTWLDDIKESLSIPKPPAIPEPPVTQCLKPSDQPQDKFVLCVWVNSELPSFISDAIHHQLHHSIGSVSDEWIIKDLPHPIENTLISIDVLLARQCSFAKFNLDGRMDE